MPFNSETGQANTEDEIDSLLFQHARADALDPALYSRIEATVLTQPLPDHNSSWVEALLNWLNPAPQARWRPLLAASCPLFLGIVIGNYYHFGVDSDAAPVDFDSWDDELSMLSLYEPSALESEIFLDGGF